MGRGAGWGRIHRHLCGGGEKGSHLCGAGVGGDPASHTAALGGDRNLSTGTAANRTRGQVIPLIMETWA